LLIGERDYSGAERLQSELLVLNKELAMARERGQALARTKESSRSSSGCSPASGGPGQGTTFTVKLPRHPAPASSA
jgi:signal transduction histidine kinase